MSKLSIGTAWDEAKAAMLAHRRLLVPVALGLVLLPAALTSMIEPQVAAGERPEPGAWMIGVMVLVAIMLMGQLAMILIINGWKGSLGEALRRAAKRLPVLLATALMIMVVMIAILVALFAILGISTTASGGIVAESLSGAGLMAVIIAFALVIVISVRLLPLMPVIATHDKGPLPSLKHSFAITSGHFLRLLAFLLLMLVLFLVVALAVGAVVGGLVTLLFGKPEPWTVSKLLIALASGAVQAGFVLFYTAMLARIAAQLDRAD